MVFAPIPIRRCKHLRINCRRIMRNDSSDGLRKLITARNGLISSILCEKNDCCARSRDSDFAEIDGLVAGYGFSDECAGDEA